MVLRRYGNACSGTVVAVATNGPLDACLLEQRRRSWVMLGPGRPVTIPSDYAVALVDELQRLRAERTKIIDQLTSLLAALGPVPAAVPQC